VSRAMWPNTDKRRLVWQGLKYVVMHSPDGTKVYGARGGEFEGIGSA